MSLSDFWRPLTDIRSAIGTRPSCFVECSIGQCEIRLESGPEKFVSLVGGPRNKVCFEKESPVDGRVREDLELLEPRVCGRCVPFNDDAGFAVVDQKLDPVDPWHGRRTL